jgi:hypothetical protein
MQTTTLDELKWMHDCTVQHVVYDASGDAARSVKIAMYCPLDLGYEPWAGKKVTLVAGRVAFARHLVWGVAGAETVDAIRPGISDSTRQSVDEAKRLGACFPGLEFTVSCHSGSTLEIICHSVECLVELQA